MDLCGKDCRVKSKNRIWRKGLVYLAIWRIGLNSNKTTLWGRFISCFACGTHFISDFTPHMSRPIWVWGKNTNKVSFKSTVTPAKFCWPKAAQKIPNLTRSTQNLWPLWFSWVLWLWAESICWVLGEFARLCALLDFTAPWIIVGYTV